MQQENVQNDPTTYGAVLKAASRLPKSKVMQTANLVWDSLKSEKNFEPNASNYGSLISCWARVSSPGAKRAADKALHLLEELENLYEKSDPKKEHLKPMQAHYSAVITAIARTKDPLGVDKASDILERMKRLHQPDIVTYTSFMMALSNGRSEESAKKAEGLLEELEEMEMKPNFSHMRPTTITYTSAIAAWAKSRTSNSAEKAEMILERLEDAYRNSGDDALCPDAAAYGSVINAWSRSRGYKNAGERAEAVLRRMENVNGKNLTNTVAYTSVITAYWKSGTEDVAGKAEALLEEMKQRSEEGNVNCLPDTVTYTTVLQTLARSKNREKAEKCWKILSELCEKYQKGDLSARPNVFTFTACLNACAFTAGKLTNRKKAIEVALRVVAEFHSHDYGPPSTPMYRTLLLVFDRQADKPADRLKYASVAFSRCCQEGLTDGSIIELLRERFPSLYEKLPRNRENEVDIPPEWRMNVKP